MDTSGDATKEREEYYMMVSHIFESKEQGYEHYNRYVKEKGLVSDWTIKSVNGPKELKGRCLVCSKEGYYLQKYFEATDQKKDLLENFLAKH
jgi:hypothetical protein